MKVRHWCMLGLTILLLMCEVAVSQLCKSLITLVDGFHTLFIVMHMALPPPQTVSMIKPPVSSSDSSASPPRAPCPSSAAPPPPPTLPAGPSVEPPPATRTATGGSTDPDQPQSNTLSAQVKLRPLFSPVSPAAPGCGLAFSSSRIQAVGGFFSTLILTSLCISYFMEIISFCLEPHPVQRPPLLVGVGAAGVLHKVLVFGLNWDQLRDERPGGDAQPETESHLEVNHRVLAEEESRDVSQSQKVQPAAAEDSLVLCNPRTSGIPDAESGAPRPPVVPEESGGGDLKDRDSGSHSREGAAVPKYDTCTGRLESPGAESSSVRESSRRTERPETGRLLSSVFVLQGLFTSLLALINSLVMLLVAPELLHGSGSCSLLVYLDPGLSLLAVVTLIATTLPQVTCVFASRVSGRLTPGFKPRKVVCSHLPLPPPPPHRTLCLNCCFTGKSVQVYRYSLLLLQATPPHVCASDLGRRIASVPGVRAVHDLHVWQLNESLSVASVHVHCYDGFPADRCADLVSAVTKVLQGVGVTCCTVQPEFASCSAPSAGSGGVVRRGDPSPPPLPACRLACGKACAGNMCCSLLEEEEEEEEEEAGGPLAPPAGETKEEPQTLVIENTFL
ncbi:proton-coupled zinc antiporter SLC30A1 isoform X1 [Embiotoca jacksoni]|uniref:proton-coupled zinc antiporter SLC30A1 isoform X1 n=1 Tax=Embiotoca jacksoni TaxID=100190 RepID=UPI003704CAD0